MVGRHPRLGCGMHIASSHVLGGLTVWEKDGLREWLPSVVDERGWPNDRKHAECSQHPLSAVLTALRQLALKLQRCNPETDSVADMRSPHSQASWLAGAAEVGSRSARAQGRPDGATSPRAA